MQDPWPVPTCPEDEWPIFLIQMCGVLSSPGTEMLRGKSMIRQICESIIEKFPPATKPTMDSTLTDMQLAAIRGVCEIIIRELDWETDNAQKNSPN